jgi:NADPH:quinone reductase-like Zn-dependent oxidoreductase
MKLNDRNEVDTKQHAIHWHVLKTFATYPYMKAIICTQYGPPDVLQLHDIPQPVPRDNEVLIRVHATTAFAGDCEMRRFDIPALFWLPLRLYMGLFIPRIKILGQEFSGEIASVGKLVTKFKPGMLVFGATDMQLGAYAEYFCIHETKAIAIKPDQISHPEAATIPIGGLNSLYYIRKANIRAGEHLLINGAGGSIGTWAVQLAKLRGATVTCVDSGEKLAMLKSIGADYVIDYRQTNFAATGKQYDIIFDIVGKDGSTIRTSALRPRGRYLLANFSLSMIVMAVWTKYTSTKQVLIGVAPYDIKELDYLATLVEAGLCKSVIDRTYRLEDMVEAHRYVDGGYKKGHVAISVTSESPE